MSTLALLVDDDERVQYVGVVTGGTRATDMQRKVQIGPVLKLGPVELESVKEQLPGSVRRHFVSERGATTGIPPATWSYALAAALQLSEYDEEFLRPLVEVIESRTSVSRARLLDVVAFERDAIATALEVYGGSKLRRAVINSAAATNDAPFIKRLRHGSVEVIEDQMIQHDILNFPGASAMMSDVVGSIRIKTKSGGLTVINANRTKVERTLGVDLVYYNEERDSFVMVQYKRMEGNDAPAFYPKADRDLADQLARMRYVAAKLGKRSSRYADFRLWHNPFFLKLSLAHSKGDWNGRMLSGMYFPIDLWDALLKTNAVIGPRGGLVVSFDRAPRRLTNSEFTSMLSRGWIGTAAGDSSTISDLVLASLSANRSVLAAVHDPRDLADEYLRDDWGRFLSPDDEFGI